MPEARVLPVGGDDLLAMRDEVVAVYVSAFGAPPANEGPAEIAAYAASLERHARKPGFRACTARAMDGRLVGFAYGWEGGPGDWWWDSVAGVVHADVRRRWFDDCFELVELAVLAGAQRRGVGAALHDAVLDLTERPHAVLSARSDATAALALYAAKGWRIVHDGLRFPGSDAPYAVLVRDR